MGIDSGYNMQAAAPGAEIIVLTRLQRVQRRAKAIVANTDFYVFRISERQLGGRRVSGYTGLDNSVNARGCSIRIGEQQGNTLFA